MIKNSVLVTGLIGVGKSSLCTELIERGYEAYDLDKFADIHVPPPTAEELANAEPIFGNFHKEDEEEYDAHNEVSEALDWVYDRERLADLIIEQTGALAFYFGLSANINELLPYFSKIILLKMQSNLLRERVANGEAMTDEDYTNLVPTWKRDWEDFIVANHGTAVVDASRSLPLVADEIVHICLNI